MAAASPWVVEVSPVEEALPWEAFSVVDAAAVAEALWVEATPWVEVTLAAAASPEAGRVVRAEWVPVRWDPSLVGLPAE